MPYNIAEPDKAYDKCHHILNPFKSNETSHFYQMDQSIFVFRVVGYCFSFLFKFNRTSCKRTVDIAVCGVCSCFVLIVYVPQKERLANMG